MNIRSKVKTVLVLVLGLPLLQMVLSWIGDLLTALGDPSVGGILGHINTALRVVWLLLVVALVILLALESFDEPHDLEG